MTYQTVGYVKTLTIKSAGNVEVLVGFAPAGTYLFEDQENAYCIFREGLVNTKDEVRAIMRRFEKDGVLAMSVVDIGMRDALIAAKVSHAKIRIEVELGSVDGEKSDVGRNVEISVIEFL